MAAESGNLDTFGEALDKIDFWGSSSTNPDDMRNNCVSVSTARMDHYKDVEELWKDLYGHSLPDRALKFPEILHLLRRTGYDFGWKKFVAIGKKTAYQVFDSTDYTGNPYDKPASGDDDMLFCYTRKDGSGHCVNYLRESLKVQYTEQAPFHYQAKRIFLDFQRHQDGDGGPQLKADIEAAEKIIVLFSVKCIGTDDDWRNAMAKRDARRQALVDAGLTPAWV
ncbi:MAG: hypothetical protein Q9208_004617 [Pyrenodesmia sp. 3 TL-2023]